MSWDAVVAICEILGLIAIVVTLVYMARQIRENTAAVASNTQQTHFDAWNSLSDLVVESPDVAELIRKGEQADVSFSGSERIRFEWLATKLFGLYESVFADKTSGLIDAALADAYERYYISFCCKPGFRSFWEAHRSWYFQQFVEHVDQKMGTDASAD
ncbi:MAG: hypothetical protein ACYTGG_10390 [Planctomycetota bacterium]|jgi:hypothetical protein